MFPCATVCLCASCVGPNSIVCCPSVKPPYRSSLFSPSPSLRQTAASNITIVCQTRLIYKGRVTCKQVTRSAKPLTIAQRRESPGHRHIVKNYLPHVPYLPDDRRSRPEALILSCIGGEKVTYYQVSTLTHANEFVKLKYTTTLSVDIKY